MNRQLEDDVDRAWSSLSPRLRTEIEGAIGHTRDELPAETFGQLALSYLGSRLMEVRTERRVRDVVADIKREVREDTKYFLNDLGQEVRESLGRLAEKLDQRDERIRYLLENMRQPQSALPPSSGSGGQPPQSPPSNVYVNTGIKMNCVYAKDGPKDCIVVQQGPGGTYGVCTVGDQVRREQILPRLFTGALGKTGCPSNRIIRVCDYLQYQRVKLS